MTECRLMPAAENQRAFACAQAGGHRFAQRLLGGLQPSPATPMVPISTQRSWPLWLAIFATPGVAFPAPFRPRYVRGYGERLHRRQTPAGQYPPVRLWCKRSARTIV
ncbi:hypothetical protein UA70_05275 [Raoultella planticola]|nr:hypothetical protein UA70_05275 [Raoultella planticola]